MQGARERSKIDMSGESSESGLQLAKLAEHWPFISSTFTDEAEDSG